MSFLVRGLRKQIALPLSASQVAKAERGEVDRVVGLFTAVKGDFEVKKMDKPNGNIGLSNSAPLVCYYRTLCIGMCLYWGI